LVGGLAHGDWAIEVEAERLQQVAHSFLHRYGQRPGAIEGAAAGAAADGFFGDRVLTEPPERDQRDGHGQIAPSLASDSMSASLYPSSCRISWRCWPSSGDGPMVVGESESLIGLPTVT